MTRSPETTIAAGVRPDAEVTPERRLSSPATVEVPVDVLDRIVGDLFAAGLILDHRSPDDDCERLTARIEGSLATLDAAVTRIRRVVFDGLSAGAASGPKRMADPAERSATEAHGSRAAWSVGPHTTLVSTESPRGFPRSSTARS